ncbi:MAG: glycoside hydrolase family 78 protein [Prolixibacteraceae bacterium]|jgi:alpha-L-rhamnosidase|nr:glycoside hydrolase family 78 protein [Prolixibacteraceae bacterium]
MILRKVFLLASFVSIGWVGLAQIGAVGLRCEYLKDPLGIDMPDPRFYWKLKSDETGQFQTGYRIIVSSSKENIEKNLGDMFDSGKKNSPQSIHIVYKGKSLKAASDYFWKVMVWDKKRVASAWSETATFSTGLFYPQDWSGAQWIAWRTQEKWETDWWKRKVAELQCTEWYLPSYFGARMSMWERYHFHDNPYDPAPLYRKGFKANKEIKNARAFISGIGYNELFINGQRIGDHQLDPGWTNYKKTILYTAYNVTGNLQKGENTIGVMLGRGNYGMLAVDHWGFYKKEGYIGQPKLMCLFKITYTDGTEENIVSDLTWKITGGPILYDCPHMGELYDATKEIPGWNKNGFNDSSWDKVVSAPSPGGALKAQLCEPIRIVKRSAVIKVEKRNREYWADAGANLAGWIRLKVNAPKGTRIGIYYGENEDPRDHGQPGGYQQMAYVAKGVKDEIAECHFSYKGYRYINILGYPGVLTKNDIEVCQVNSDVAQVGRFSSSDTTLNAIHRICTKSLISNLHSIPTDCPHREKNGWMGDAVTGMEFGMANYDLAALMTKYTRDIFDTQDAEGRIPTFTPAPATIYPKVASPLWASACVHIPWYMYNYYGDTRLFEQYWDKMKLFSQAVWKLNGVKDKSGIFTDGLADWCSPFGNMSDEGSEVYSTMNFYLVLKRLSQMAVVLNKKEDAAEFSKQAEQVREAIYTYCFDKVNVRFVGITPSDYRQGINAMALQNEIVKPEHKDKVMEQLLQDIQVNRDFHFYGGIFTGYALWEMLPKNNLSELTYKVAINPTYPGYGFMLKNGATSLWEFWQDKYSHIHHFLGFVDNFLIRYVAGINVNYKVPGYAEIIFSPNFIAKINHAEAEYESIHGMASIAWKREPEGQIQLKISVPCNGSGKLMLPENIKSIQNSDGKELQIKKDESQKYVMLPSGKHQVKAYVN